MQHTNLAAEWQGRNENVRLNVTVLLFTEDDIHFAYVPSFDLTGYGSTPEEAGESLKIVVDEFLRYTTNKKTFLPELKRLGWKIRSKYKPMQAPQLSDLIPINEQLREIINYKQYSTSNFQVSMPAVA